MISVSCSSSRPASHPRRRCPTSSVAPYASAPSRGALAAEGRAGRARRPCGGEGGGRPCGEGGRGGAASRGGLGRGRGAPLKRMEDSMAFLMRSLAASSLGMIFFTTFSLSVADDVSADTCARGPPRPSAPAATATPPGGVEGEGRGNSMLYPLGWSPPAGVEVPSPRPRPPRSPALGPPGAAGPPGPARPARPRRRHVKHTSGRRRRGNRPGLSSSRGAAKHPSRSAASTTGLGERPSGIAPSLG